ncbi:MAG: hypothetical protein AAGU10_01475 [Methanosarcina mazei]|uniref:hypothetical protein n=1 Tax=Methanosarcina soligelidi TaxID=1036677 RepID=UPI001362DE08|nr:hypothetical protein [Methanosarcina soligelidi]
MEKLIKARPIKMVTSFLAILEPDTAAHIYQHHLRAYRLVAEVRMRRGKIKNKDFGIYENSGFKKYYPEHKAGIFCLF